MTCVSKWLLMLGAVVAACLSVLVIGLPWLYALYYARPGIRIPQLGIDQLIKDPAARGQDGP